MKTIALFDPIRQELERVERKIYQAVQTEDEQLSAIARSLFSHRGKLIRPALVILSSGFHPVAEGQVTALAAAVEMLHTATLVHDDLIDSASLRRGAPTLNSQWNHSIAVLIGDYLFSRAAALAAETGNIRVVNIFSQTLTIICDGELRQHFNRQQLPYSVDDYYRRIFAKTAALFAAATEAGAILSNATQSEIQALRDYGHNVGLAFQIVDDVLDLVGDEDKMGKPAGSDLRQGIITLPMLYFLSQGNDPTTIRRVIDEGHRDAASVQAAINAIRASGAIETALAEARRFSQYAQEALQALPAHPNRQILFDLADFIIQRDY